MTVALMTSEAVWQGLSRVRQTAPLIHNITNFVVMNNTANALLALGASPAMVHAVEEVEEFAALSQAVVINIGTLSSPWIAAMARAAKRASTLGIPWVLDPVGAGATAFRRETAARLARHRPAVIRGNASEILALAGPLDAISKGVDSGHAAEEAIDTARELARTTGAIVAITGKVDYATDGSTVMAIANGDPLMTAVTGMGCTATAMTGAFLAVNGNRLHAAVSALTVLGVAGEIATKRARGPGSLQVELLDALHTLDRETLAAHARISTHEAA